MLSDAAEAAILAHEQAAYVSAASIYEADYKVRAGRLPMMPAPAADIARALGLIALPIDEADATRAAAFAFAHSDPFDRLIAAQAIMRQLVVVTRDEAIAGFGAAVIW